MKKIIMLITAFTLPSLIHTAMKQVTVYNFSTHYQIGVMQWNPETNQSVYLCTLMPRTEQGYSQSILIDDTQGVSVYALNPKDPNTVLPTSGPFIHNNHLRLSIESLPTAVWVIDAGKSLYPGTQFHAYSMSNTLRLTPLFPENFGAFQKYFPQFNPARR